MSEQSILREVIETAELRFGRAAIRKTVGLALAAHYSVLREGVKNSETDYLVVRLIGQEIEIMEELMKGVNNGEKEHFRIK